MEIGHERILRTTAALILGEIKEINVISAADVSPCCTATYLPEVVIRPNGQQDLDFPHLINSIGNQIWWNGGDGSGQIGMSSYWGSYSTASSTFFDAKIPSQAQYGIFVSNAKGPGSITYSYASNMGDSGFYVGACADCNATLQFVHSSNNPQGFSGSNSGGHLVIEDSEWDHNQSGIVPSSLAVYDPPSPQDGACPNAPGSCTIIQRNYVHDNNNPNLPVNFAVNPLAGSVLVGSGIDLSGGRNNTVQQNLRVS